MVAGPVVLIDHDAAARANHETRGCGERRVRSHTNCDNDQLRVKDIARSEFDRVGMYRDHRRAQVQCHVVSLDLVGHQLGHLGIEGGEYLVCRFDDRSRHATVSKVLRDLNADKPTTDHHRTSGHLGDCARHALHVFDGAKRQGATDSRDRGDHG